MKKGNRVPAKILAFFLSCLMLFSCLSVGISAADLTISGGEENGKNYEFKLSQNTDANGNMTNDFVLTIDMEGINEILETRELTKEDLEAYMPEIVWNALMNRDIPGMEELLASLQETGLLNQDVLTKFLPQSIIDQCIEEVLAGLTDIESVLEPGTMENLMTDNLPKIMQSQAIINAIITNDQVIDNILKTDGVVDIVLDEVSPEQILGIVKGNSDITDKLLTEAKYQVLKDALIDSLKVEELVDDLKDTLMNDQDVIDEINRLYATTIINYVKANVNDWLDKDEFLKQYKTELYGAVTMDDVKQVFGETKYNELVSDIEADVKADLENQVKTITDPIIEKWKQKAEDKANAGFDFGVADPTDKPALEAAIEKWIEDNAKPEITAELEKIGLDTQQKIEAKAEEMATAKAEEQVEALVKNDASYQEKLLNLTTVNNKISEIVGGMKPADIEGFLQEGKTLVGLITAAGIKLTDLADNDVIIAKVKDIVFAENSTIDPWGSFDQTAFLEKTKDHVDLLVELIGGVNALISELNLDMGKIAGKIGSDKLKAAVLGGNGMPAAYTLPELITILQNNEPALYDEIVAEAMNHVMYDKVFAQIDVKGMAKDIVLSIDSVSLNDTPVYYAVATGMTVDMNAAKNALMLTVPTMEKLETIEANEEIYGLALTVVFGHGADQKAITYDLSIVLVGDTSKVNAAASKLFNYFTYEIEEDSVTAHFNDSSAWVARAMAKLLNTERLDNDEKTELLSVFAMTGDDLIEKLDEYANGGFEKYRDILNKIEDKVEDQGGKIAAVENKIDSVIGGDYVAFLEKLCAKAIEVLELVKARVPANVFEEMSIMSTFYDGEGNFGASVDVTDLDLIDKAQDAVDAVAAKDLGNDKLNALVDKLQGILGSETLAIVDAMITQKVELSAELTNVRKISYYASEDDAEAGMNAVYETFLPVGVELHITNMAAIEEMSDLGKTNYSWVELGSDEIPGAMVDYDVRIYAEYEEEPGPGPGPGPGPDTPDVPSKVTYKVTFMADGHTVDVVLYERGQKELHYIPAVPAKEGYVGVWEDFELNNKDIIVNAIYTPASTTLTATFVADGVVVAQVPFKAGDLALSEVPAVPAKRGFTGAWESYTLGVTDITINAIYTAIDPLVATFVADGVVVAEIEFYPGDTKLTGVPTVPAKTGYSAKWASYKLGNTDITVNAVYTAKTYEVNFRSNGGNGTMGIQKLTYDKAEALKANTFTRSGYKFVGWNTKADGTGTSYKDGETVKNLLVSGTLFLYAQWQKEETPVETTYTATFKADGVTVATVTFKAGDTKLSNVPAVPAKAGYAGAWEDYKLGNANITINAIYTANTYTIVFNANGGNGTMASQTMTYDVSAALTANTLTRDGYTFAGWNTAADGSGTSYTDGQSVKNLAESGEVTLYAQWTEVSEPIVDPPVEPPVEPAKNFTPVIVVIIVVVVIATAGVVYGAVIYTKKKMMK